MRNCTSFTWNMIYLYWLFHLNLNVPTRTQPKPTHEYRFECENWIDEGRSISLGSNPALPIRHGATPTPGLRFKNLGKSGLRVSNVGLGTWPVFSPGVPEEQAEAILKLAIESGINMFDISEAHSGSTKLFSSFCFFVYFFVELKKKTFLSLIFRTLSIASSRVEVELGKIIQKSGWKRTSYIITTKIYWSTKSEERGLSRKHIIESVKASLQRLQLPYIDIVIIYKADSMCPMEGKHRLFSFHIRIYCHVLRSISLHNSKRWMMELCDHRKLWTLHSLKNCMHSSEHMFDADGHFYLVSTLSFMCDSKLPQCVDSLRRKEE